ncbi:hypothetical protein ACHAXT_011809 [Thalassiosira profunda]
MAAAVSSSNSGGIPADLVDSLGWESPRLALLALADESERAAARLAEELAASLSATTTAAAAKPHPSPTKQPRGKAPPRDGPASPIPLPKSLQNAPRPPPAAAISDDDATQQPQLPHPTPSRSHHHNPNPSHPLARAALASESILASLAKIATGGSAASSEMRALESRRRALDLEAGDVARALALRECCTKGGESLMGRRYGDAARAVADVNAILDGRDGRGGATERAKAMAGEEALAAHQRTTEVLKRAVGERFEAAVRNGDVAGLSELTPLLGMLSMAELGVKLYLQYSQSCLVQEMTFEADDAAAEEDGPVPEGMSRAALRRQRAAQRQAALAMTAPLKLARIYNAAVTHLRHHLPMVAYALGEADGDAALVQLVHVEAEKRAVDILRDHMAAKELGRTVRRAEAVAAKVEERYAGGTNAGGIGGMGGSRDEMDLAFLGGMDAGALMGGLGGDAANIGGGDAASRREAALQDDCGFALEVGTLADVDAALEEWALVMQHTESYERFVRHAAAEVVKARQLRGKQKREERRRRREREETEGDDDNTPSSLASPRNKNAAAANDDDDDETMVAQIEILPPHTALNEVAAEIGGCYSSLERCLLLAGLQRAVVQASFPDDATFAPAASHNTAAEGGEGGGYGAAGSRALQTNLVEEALFAARRSTLRAFATGHVGTASAAANVCADVLGRVLLEVLVQRAERGAAILKPGEGLLDDGQAGLGQAAMSLANKGLRGAAARAGAKVGDASDDGTAAALRLRGAARAAANFNDLAVAAEYTRRLEGHLLKEIDGGYPAGHDTEQLRMCVKGLGGVVEAFSQASTRSVEELISAVLPRARQVVTDAVGSDGGPAGATAAATNFLGSPVYAQTGGAGGGSGLDYDLDDAAFELAQISEGGIGRACAGLDELLEPVRVHLVPALSDEFVVGVLGGVAKRLEAAIRKSKFTPLGAIRLDSDVRYLMTFAKDRIDSPKLKSNVTLCRACPPLARLNQIALLLNVDDLEDALDLISVSKRKGQWDLKLDDAKALLGLRVDFDLSKVNDLLQVEDE